MVTNGQSVTDSITQYGGIFAIVIGIAALFLVIFGLFYFRNTRSTFTEEEIVPGVKARRARDADDEYDYDFLNSEAGIAAKLDLARAYIDMGDFAAARQVLGEVRSRGKPDQKQQAQQILDEMKTTA